MQKVFLRAGALAVVTVALTLTPASLKAQDAGQEPASSRPQQPHAATPEQQNEAQMPASGHFTTHETKTFSGRIIKENGGLVLKDPVTKVRYKLSDRSKAKQYNGKQVKVSGKLDMSTNTIQVESIEPIS